MHACMHACMHTYIHPLVVKDNTGTSPPIDVFPVEALWNFH